MQYSWGNPSVFVCRWEKCLNRQMFRNTGVSSSLLHNFVGFDKLYTLFPCCSLHFARDDANTWRLHAIVVEWEAWTKNLLFEKLVKMYSRLHASQQGPFPFQFQSQQVLWQVWFLNDLSIRTPSHFSYLSDSLPYLFLLLPFLLPNRSLSLPACRPTHPLSVAILFPTYFFLFVILLSILLPHLSMIPFLAAWGARTVDKFTKSQNENLFLWQIFILIFTPHHDSHLVFQRTRCQFSHPFSSIADSLIWIWHKIPIEKRTCRMSEKL